MSDPPSSSTSQQLQQQQEQNKKTSGFSRVFAKIFGSAAGPPPASAATAGSVAVAAVAVAPSTACGASNVREEEEKGNDDSAVALQLEVVKPPPAAYATGRSSSQSAQAAGAGAGAPSSSSAPGRMAHVAEDLAAAAADDDVDYGLGVAFHSEGTAAFKNVNDSSRNNNSNINNKNDTTENNAIADSTSPPPPPPPPPHTTTSTTADEEEVRQPFQKPPSKENSMDFEHDDDHPMTTCLETTDATLLETTTTTLATTTAIEWKASEETIDSTDAGIPNNSNNNSSTGEILQSEHKATNINSNAEEDEKTKEERELVELAQLLVELQEQQNRSSVSPPTHRHHRHHHHHRRTSIRRRKRTLRWSTEASDFTETEHQQEDVNAIMNLVQQDEVAEAAFHKRIKTAIANSLNDDNNVPTTSVHPEATAAESTTTPTVLPVSLSPREQEEQISLAAALVSRALIQGMWPSPYRHLAASAVNSNNYPAHSAHMSMVGASLEKFAKDIIVPALVWRESSSSSSSDNKNITPTSEATAKATVEQETTNPESVVVSPTLAATNNLRYPPPRRVFWGALLLFRELLCQNAATIFGPQSPPSSNNNSSSTNNDEETFFATQVLATAVVLTGLALEPEDHEKGENDSHHKSSKSKPHQDVAATSSMVDQLKNDFLELVERYDRADAEFADGLAPLLFSQRIIPPKLAGNHEGMAWQMSCNWQRERHPLRLSTSSSSHHPKLADPTAVHVSILQSQGAPPRP